MYIQSIFPDLDQRRHWRSFSATVLVLFTAQLLSSCADAIDRDKPSTTPAALAVDSPAAGTETFSLLQQNGTIWMNQERQKVSLRGINLGNWLTMEIWMFDQSGTALGANIPDQCTVEEILTDRFSAETKDELIETFWRSWITEKDWDIMDEANFNVIRIPFLYSMIENDAIPMTLLGNVAADEFPPVPANEDIRDNTNNAWRFLDWSIEQARKRNMYVILDLHGAPGRQGTEHHSGCENQNMLWGSEAFRARTVWLWEQLATRYRNEDVIAGYGLLNEPWGTDSETLRDFMVEMAQAIRVIDDRHIILFHGHNDDGIEAYGDPTADYGIDNVAFEIHAYPGLFGQGSIGYIEHRNWLTCGPDGTTGVCDVARQARDVFTPMLVGETQPWTSLGELGGPITRATYDRYNELNWAVTAWSYKTTSLSGGVGSGPWGLVTNDGEQLLAKADTWGCDNWESTFDQACSAKARLITPLVIDPDDSEAESIESQTMYLVIKTGANGSIDVTYDNIQLIEKRAADDDAGSDVNILTNGEFNSAQGWTRLAISGDVPASYDFAHEPESFAGSNTGTALRITSAVPVNGMIFQPVQIKANRQYEISGKFRENSASAPDAHEQTWAEVYLIPDQPVAGVDVLGQVLQAVDLHSSSQSDISNFFASFADMKIARNEWVIDALSAAEPADLFVNIPQPPSGIEIELVTAGDSVVTGATVTWAANPEEGILGYRVFRSNSPRTNFVQIAEYAAEDERTYSDSGLDAKAVYYYFVTAFNATDVSYASATVATGRTIFDVPSFIQAEDFIRSHPGVVTEPASDIGGGSNIGHFEPGRWADYQLRVENAGSYDLRIRVASLVGNVNFRFLANDTVLTDENGQDIIVNVPNTGGWQQYVTLLRTLPLPAGDVILRLESIDDQWNLNWIDFGSGGGGGAVGGGGVAPRSSSDPRPSLTPINPTVPTAGTNANVSHDGSDVVPWRAIALGVSADGDAAQGYAGFNFAELDASLYDLLEFDVFDNAGPNTFRVTLTDADGAEWIALTPNRPGGRSQAGAQARVSVDLTAAATQVDLGRLTGLKVGVSRAGSYSLSGFAFYQRGRTVNLPDTIASGTSADASIIYNDTKEANVISLTVTVVSQVDQSYAGITVPDIDISRHTQLTFDVLDMQGSNTVNVRLVDSAGRGWSAWTADSISGRTERDVWRTLSLDISAAAGLINLSQIREIRVAMYHTATYLLSDFSFFAPTGSDLTLFGPDRRPALVLPAPTAVAVGGVGGVVATLVSHEAREGDVISLVKQAEAQTTERYVSFSFAATDASLYDGVRFDIFDSRDGSTVNVALVDSAGVVCRMQTADDATGRSVRNVWTTVSLPIDFASDGTVGCTPANSSFDVGQISAIRLSQDNPGTYLYSDFAFFQAGTPIANPTEITTAAASGDSSVENNIAKDKKVISLVKTVSGDAPEGSTAVSYVGFSFAPMDISGYSLLQFDVRDGQGSNTIHVTFIDAAGAAWSRWTEDADGERTVQGIWTTIELPTIEAAADIDLTSLTQIRVAAYHPGIYLFSDFTWFAEPGVELPVRDGPDRRPRLALSNPTAVRGMATDSTITVETAVAANLAKNKEVVSFTKINGGGDFMGNYVEFDFADEFDLSQYDALNFDVLDMGSNNESNTVHISLIDGDGTLLCSWTPDSEKPTKAVWSTVLLSLDFLTQAKQGPGQGNCAADKQGAVAGFDLTSVASIRLSEWHPGTYLYSDFVFIQNGRTIANPTVVGSGAAASASLVNGPESSRKVSADKVISVRRNESGDISQAFASFTFAAIDFSDYNLLQFEVFDEVGANAFRITLIDSASMTWSVDTPDSRDEKTLTNAWTTLRASLAGASGINLNQIIGLRVAPASPGTYQVSDFRLYNEAAPEPQSLQPDR